MRRLAVLLLVSGFVIALASTATATPIQTFGSGTAVASADLTATFDSVVDGTSLDLLQEGGLTFDYFGSASCQPAPIGCGTPVQLSAFDGGFIYSGGNLVPLIITTDGGAPMAGIEFILSAGFQITSTGGYWESYNDGVLSGSGGFNAPSIPTVFALADPSGFDELRIAMFNTNTLPSSFVDLNAIAIDNVSVELVPEPATAALLALSLAGLAARQGRRV